MGCWVWVDGVFGVMGWWGGGEWTSCAEGKAWVGGGTHHAAARNAANDGLNENLKHQQVAPICRKLGYLFLFSAVWRTVSAAVGVGVVWSYVLVCGMVW